MKAPSEDKNHRQILDFLQKVTGIDFDILNYILGLYHLCICAQLSREKTVTLKGLLVLIPYKGKNPQVRTRLSKPLHKAMYEGASQQGKRLVKLRQDVDIDISSIEEYLVVDEVEDQKVEEEVSIYETNSGLKKRSNKGAKEKIKHSLLSYLLHEFVYGQDWTHPISKLSYSRHTIAKSLLYIRNASPNMYALLYSLWIGTESRRRLYRRLGIRDDEVEEIMNRAIDVLMISITHPGFVPSCIKEIDNWQAEWSIKSDHS